MKNQEHIARLQAKQQKEVLESAKTHHLILIASKFETAAWILYLSSNRDLQSLTFDQNQLSSDNVKLIYALVEANPQIIVVIHVYHYEHILLAKELLQKGVRVIVVKRILASGASKYFRNDLGEEHNLSDAYEELELLGAKSFTKGEGGGSAIGRVLDQF